MVNSTGDEKPRLGTTTGLHQGPMALGLVSGRDACRRLGACNKVDDYLPLSAISAAVHVSVRTPHAFSIRQTNASGAIAQAVAGLKHGMTALCIYGKAETVTKAIELSTSPERRGPGKP